MAQVCSHLLQGEVHQVVSQLVLGQEAAWVGLRHLVHALEQRLHLAVHLVQHAQHCTRGASAHNTVLSSLRLALGLKSGGGTRSMLATGGTWLTFIGDEGLWRELQRGAGVLDGQLARGGGAHLHHLDLRLVEGVRPVRSLPLLRLALGLPARDEECVWP